MTLLIKSHDGPGSFTEIRASAELARKTRLRTSCHTSSIQVVLLVMMLVVLVSAGWSWLLSPCVVGVGAGGAGVAAGGGAGGAPSRNSQTRVPLAGYCMNMLGSLVVCFSSCAHTLYVRMYAGYCLAPS